MSSCSRGGLICLGGPGGIIDSPASRQAVSSRGPPPQPEYIIIEYSLSYVKIVEVGPVAWDKVWQIYFVETSLVHRLNYNDNPLLKHRLTFN